jgi:hypothetical protein
MAVVSWFIGERNVVSVLVVLGCLVVSVLAFDLTFTG